MVVSALTLALRCVTVAWPLYVYTASWCIDLAITCEPYADWTSFLSFCVLFVVAGWCIIAVSVFVLVVVLSRVINTKWNRRLLKCVSLAANPGLIATIASVSFASLLVLSVQTHPGFNLVHASVVVPLWMATSAECVSAPAVYWSIASVVFTYGVWRNIRKSRYAPDCTTCECGYPVLLHSSRCPECGVAYLQQLPPPETPSGE